MRKVSIKMCVHTVNKIANKNGLALTLSLSLSLSTHNSTELFNTMCC